MIAETWFDKNSIKCLKIVEDKLFNDQYIEKIWCSIQIGKEKILIGCIYRPPTASSETSRKILRSIKMAKKHVDREKYTGLIIAGDFNHNNAIWNNTGGLTMGNGKKQQLRC